MKTQSCIPALSQIGIITTAIILYALLAGCQQESRGFVLPEGNIERGKQTFEDLACTRCHEVADLKWTGREEYNDPHIHLGGEVTSMKTYGELVTSVINPSHKISQQHLTDQVLTRTDGTSRMEQYKFNEIMTVQELIDIVAFLQSEYKLVPPDNPYPYPGY